MGEEARNRTPHRKKIVILFAIIIVTLIVLMGRLAYLMIYRSEYYSQEAQRLHERERDIKAERGKIIDANGVVLADNRTVCTISVIHSQIENPEEVISVLSKELELSEEAVRKRVEKYSSIERVKANVDKEIGDKIREYHLAGVKVDEDYKRYYPYNELASKVLGFTGGDNQGIIGLEVIYEEYLKGEQGTILTMTDARGVEVSEAGEERIEPVNGNHLVISLDSNIQKYAQQIALKAMEQKSAEAVNIIVMNPQNGEIMAMVNVPEFNLNEPYTYDGDSAGMTAEEKQDALNRMWRNGCINDTYEPGSTFKMITAAAGLESGAVKLDDHFGCPGFVVVEDRKIRCHKIQGHGAQNFVQATMNSCNPVFVTVGLRLGQEKFYDYFKQFGLLKKTGIDLPGEANTIMHKLENIGMVELATVSFGQSFQITPIQLAATASSIVNGGMRVTPHFGVKVANEEGTLLKKFTYEKNQRILSEETSKNMQNILRMVVDEGGGRNAKIEGYSIGGKTATSQTLPRGSGRYISSFVGFAPAENPEILTLLIIHNPQGTYYGGTIAAPLVKELYENILPYLGMQPQTVSDAKE